MQSNMKISQSELIKLTKRASKNFEVKKKKKKCKH